MKIFLLGIFFSVASVALNVNAGVALHCENDDNGSVLCDVIATGKTKIEGMSWAAVSPAVILQDDYLGASFGCLSDHYDSGVIILDYVTNSGITGSAGFSLDCNSARTCTLPPEGGVGEKPRPNGAC